MIINLYPQQNVSVLHCSQGDTTLRKWRLPIYFGDARWVIDADQVKLICENGAEVICEVENNRVVIDCTEELAARAGRFRCTLEFTKGAEVLHSGSFALEVEDIA